MMRNRLEYMIQKIYYSILPRTYVDFEIPFTKKRSFHEANSLCDSMILTWYWRKSESLFQSKRNDNRV